MLGKLKKNYFLLISTFLILYFFFNLLDGERGLFSYFKKKEILVNLKIEEANLSNKIKELDEIVFASSSGATQAGLMLAKSELGLDVNLRGINIDKLNHEQQSFNQAIADLANSAAKQFALDKSFTANEVCLDDNYLGEGYGIIGDAEREAARKLLEAN